MANDQNPIEIELGPGAAEGTYSNLVFIAHSPSEVILDFARMLPGVAKARVYSRIIMTPQHAKATLQALEQNLKNYEGQYGAIKLPGEERREMGFKSTSTQTRPGADVPGGGA